MAVVFPKDSVVTLNIIFAFTCKSFGSLRGIVRIRSTLTLHLSADPLPSLYALSFLSTLRAREVNSSRYEAEKNNSRMAFPPSSSSVAERTNGEREQAWNANGHRRSLPVGGQRIELGEALSWEASLGGRERDLEKGGGPGGGQDA